MSVMAANRKRERFAKNSFYAVLFCLGLCLFYSLSSANNTPKATSGGSAVSSGGGGTDQGGTFAGTCGDQLNTKGYHSPSVLNAGSFGTSFKTTLVNTEVALKISPCGEKKTRPIWEYENSVYQGLTNYFGEQYLGLIVKGQQGSFSCNGSLEVWEGLSTLDSKKVACSAGCCVTAAEFVSGPRLTEYLKSKYENQRTATMKDAKDPRAWLFQISFALFAAFVDTGFQHWDLKTENIMTEKFPKNTIKQCFSWMSEQGRQLRCFGSDITNNLHIKLIDFDRSTLGGLPGKARVKRNATWNENSNDAKKLVQICEELYEVEKCQDKRDLKSPLNDFTKDLANVNKQTPSSDIDLIELKKYQEYAQALQALLHSNFFTPLFEQQQTCNPGDCEEYTVISKNWWKKP